MSTARALPTDSAKPEQENEGDTRIGPFLFKASIPVEVRQTVQDAFTEAAWLVPGWCQLIAVHWGSNDAENTSLMVHVHYEYRWAALTVFPCWLEQGTRIRREDVVHELLHLSINVIADYARETFESLLDDAPKFGATVEKELRRRVESTTQDLAYMIDRKMSAQA